MIKKILGFLLGTLKKLGKTELIVTIASFAAGLTAPYLGAADSDLEKVILGLLTMSGIYNGGRSAVKAKVGDMAKSFWEKLTKTEFWVTMIGILATVLAPRLAVSPEALTNILIGIAGTTGLYTGGRSYAKVKRLEWKKA